MNEKNQERLNAWGPVILSMAVAGIGNIAVMGYMWGEMRSDIRLIREASTLELRGVREQVQSLSEQIRTMDARQWEARTLRASAVTGVKSTQ